MYGVTPVSKQIQIIGHICIREVWEYQCIEYSTQQAKASSLCILIGSHTLVIILDANWSKITKAQMLRLIFVDSSPWIYYPDRVN